MDYKAKIKERMSKLLFLEMNKDGFKENNINIKIPSLNDMKRNIIQKSIYSIFQGESPNKKEDDETDEKLDSKQEKDLDEILNVLGEILSGV